MIRLRKNWMTLLIQLSDPREREKSNSPRKSRMHPIRRKPPLKRMINSIVVRKSHLRGNIMKYRTLIVTALSIFLLSGCASFFTFYKEIAIDKVYVPKQCPTFDHQFEIPGKKYKSNDVA